MKSEKKTILSNNFTNEQLRAALFYVEDLMERCVCQFFLLGDLAQNVRLSPDAKLSGRGIRVAIRKNEWDTAKVLRDILLPDQTEHPTKVRLEFKGVPIQLIIVDEKDSFFTHPDTAFFEGTQFSLPNPFNKYWEVRTQYE